MGWRMIPRMTFEMVMSHDPRQLPRASRTAIRRANQDAGEYEDERYIPKHFEWGADKRYGYRPRKSRFGKQRYQDFKQQQGLPPLVFTGATKDMVTRTGKVTSRPEHWRLKASIPISGSTRVGRKDVYVTKARKNLEKTVAEIEVVAEFEQRHLARLTGQKYAEYIEQVGRRPRRIVVNG